MKKFSLTIFTTVLMLVSVHSFASNAEGSTKFVEIERGVISKGGHGNAFSLISARVVAKLRFLERMKPKIEVSPGNVGAIAYFSWGHGFVKCEVDYDAIDGTRKFYLYKNHCAYK